jgi:hypothetical protein
MVIKARYERGVFKPLDKVDLKEGTVLDIYVPSEAAARRPIASLPFAGMWKNRRDIGDGVAYVNELRDNPRA